MRIFIQGIPRPDVRMTRNELFAVPSRKNEHKFNPDKIKKKWLRDKVLRYIKLRAWKDTVAWTAKSARIQPIMKGPIKISATFHMKQTQKCKPNNYVITTPDLENLLKPVKDALKGIAWKDDSQVCVYGEMRKVYAMGPGKEGVSLEIKAL